MKLFKVKLKICEKHLDLYDIMLVFNCIIFNSLKIKISFNTIFNAHFIGLQLFFLVAIASAKAKQVTKEKPSFATETTMSLSKISFNFKQLYLKGLHLMLQFYSFVIVK
jgi:hypothetical protein